MVKAYVVSGLGIGCEKEVAHAYELAGADTEIVHINRLLSGDVSLDDVQILNLSGGFLHGDRLGSAMCAVNEMDRSGLKDRILEFARAGGVVYGQCNGFQELVKSGLLPGIDGDYSQQTVTLTHNDVGGYRVAPVLHGLEADHFAFEGIDDTDLWLWCRHGEGKLVFSSPYGLVSEEEGEEVRDAVNDRHVLLRYIDPDSLEETELFPYNPNGSVDGIAGLVDPTGNIFGHMAHTEVGVYESRDPRWFLIKDAARREGFKAIDIDPEDMDGVALRVFKNIVRRFK